MSNEIRLNVALAVQVPNTTTGELTLNYSRQASFARTLTTAKGPCVGTITVPVGGCVVDLSQLTTPTFAWLANLDPTNFVQFGLYDGSRFRPIGEIGPGEAYPFKFARDLREDYTNTGTGTTGSTVERLFFKANTAACNVTIEVFEN